MIKEVRLKFQENIQRTPAVMSFRFISQEKIDFLPGQFLQLIFDENNKNNRELNKYLSFSSAPNHNYIEVTKRLSDSKFSQKLKNLRAGDEVLAKLPLGNCVFKKEYKKIGFLIGGIGITPVVSIIEYIATDGLSADVLMLYSNKKEDDIAFRKELDYWQSKNKDIKVIYTLTECQPKDKSCIFSSINKELIIKKEYAITDRVIFIFGPPKMVEAMKNLCIEIGCKKENLRTESFIGY